ncbi:glycosyltransferase [Fidelibacter multiformis]|uniref:glycosyltransferase n=1 Tax=Fidelibacter multiformis TaxID=3377529 RepID=UPI0037DD11F0
MNKKENILYIGGFEFPDRNAAAQRVINNSKLLSELNFKVFFNGINKSIERDDQLFKKFNAYNFLFYSKAVKYPDSVKKWFIYITSISKVKQIVEKDLKNNVAMVIAYNYPAIKLWRLRNYCKKRKIKIIADVTEWYQPEGSFLLKSIKKIDNSLRMKYVHFKMDGIIAISNFLMNFYKKKTCVKLPPLIDKSELKWRNSNIYSKNKIRVLTYVGSPGAGKKDRLDLIIKSLSEIKKHYPDFLFQIIGISESEYKTSFSNQPVSQNIRDNILFYGRKGHLEALDLLKSSDFSIFIRDNNLVNTAGFPTKFVESITAGIPVLTNLTSDLKDYLFDGKTGFILDISTNENLNKSLLKALSIDNSQLLKMKQHCADSELFSYKKFKNSTAVFFQHLEID